MRLFGYALQVEALKATGVKRQKVRRESIAHDGFQALRYKEEEGDVLITKLDRLGKGYGRHDEEKDRLTDPKVFVIGQYGLGAIDITKQMKMGREKDGNDV